MNILKVCAVILAFCAPQALAQVEAVTSFSPATPYNWSSLQTFSGGISTSNLTTTGLGNSATPGSIINSTASFAYPTVDDRPRYFSTTLTQASGSSSGIEEAFFNDLQLFGPGTVTGEINMVHPYFQCNANCVVGPAGIIETFEASMENFGSLGGTFTDYLGLIHNASTGTMNNAIGFSSGLTNDAGGTVGNYVAYNCNGVGGTAPTVDYCLKNSDPSGLISTLGHVSVGVLGDNGANLFVNNGSFSGNAVDVNNGSVHVLRVQHSGTVDMQGGQLTLGLSGTNTGEVDFQSSSGGQIRMFANGALSGNILFVPNFNSNDTLAGLSHNQTFGATQTFSSVLNITGALQSGGVAGVSKTCIASGATLTIANGIITAASGC